MSKVKVPEAFDLWYKQLGSLDNTTEAAMYLIGSQGWGYTVADEDNVMLMNFNLSDQQRKEVIDFVKSHQEDAMRAVLDGYEVEEELYYIRIPHYRKSCNFVNYDKEKQYFFTSDSIEDSWVKTKFTMKFIEKNLPELKQFAVKVKE